MFLQACAPQVTGPDGEASQADKEADPGGDGDTGGDHEGGCDAEPGPVCTGVPIGDQATCVSPDDLLVAAQGACAAEGLIAVDVSPSWNCEGGQSSFAKVLCCDSGAPAGVPVQPPDPGPSPAGGLGDGVTCVANADYLALAQDACAQIGMTLLDLYTTDDCSADASRYAKYLCQ